MDKRLELIQDYFSKLGINKEIASIYFSLYSKGPQTISQLTRSSGIERTRIYRLLDEMNENSLVEIEIHYKSKVLRAVPISNLHILLTKKEQELAKLQEELPKIEQLLADNKRLAKATRIEFYYGPDGVKQMFWNEIKATKKVDAILYENMQIKTDEKFFERWVNRCNERDLKFRSVVSDNFIQSQVYWYSTHNNEKLKNWQGRYIKNDTFPINHSTLIYDDVTAFFNWGEEDIFGVEIYNHEIAEGQRQFFEMLWLQASPIPRADQVVKK